MTPTSPIRPRLVPRPRPLPTATPEPAAVTPAVEPQPSVPVSKRPYEPVPGVKRVVNRPKIF